VKFDEVRKPLRGFEEGEDAPPRRSWHEDWRSALAEVQREVLSR
jgi:hypothetical protein